MLTDVRKVYQMEIFDSETGTWRQHWRAHLTVGGKSIIVSAGDKQIALDIIGEISQANLLRELSERKQGS